MYFKTRNNALSQLCHGETQGIWLNNITFRDLVIWAPVNNVAMGEWGPHSHKHKLNMADFILNMPLRFFARVFGNPAGDPVLLKSRGVTLLRDK